ncbi:MAG: MBOAT family O-acyltransferase, partial [Pseudomonadota bacterium]
TVGIIANLSILVVFKYLGWITESAGLQRVDIPLPLGISFFTFQAMSMLVDVYRGERASKNPLDTGLYIAMFPQLVAGPIVRWTEVAFQIRDRTESWDKVCSGIKLFVMGLAQKVLIADTLSGPADLAFASDPGSLALGAAWIGIAAFSLQIYYDFAGYSNMAIGLGRVFGFEFPRNFEHPYSSASFQEFWRRWHMTLSRWFRDYLYIPLGGSRGGEVRTYGNLLVVFILCGLWHGASWTFLLWGLWHGAFLIAERLGRQAGFPKFPRFVGVAYTVTFVAFGWVLFRSESLAQSLGYWAAMLGQGGTETVALTMPEILALSIGTLLAWDGWKKMQSSNRAIHVSSQAIAWPNTLILLILCFATVAATTHQPFLYFRF